MIEGGETVDRMPLGHYVGKGLGLDLSGRPKRHPISKEDIRNGLAVGGLQDLKGKGWILLLLTGYTAKSQTPDWLQYPDLTKGDCDYIIDKGNTACGLYS